MSRELLLIMTPTVGAPSETFIKRHVTQIAPGNTALIFYSHAEDATWDTPAGMPLLEISKLRPSRALRAYRKLRRIVGYPMSEYRDLCIRGFIERSGAAVAMSEWMHYSLPYYRICQSLGIPFYVHTHGYDVTFKMLSDPERQAEYRTYADAAGIITVSQMQKERLASMVGIPAEKIHVNHPGIDVPATPLEHPTRETINCLAVGRMVAKKAPLITLEAFDRAYRSDSRLRLDYIGDGPLMDEAKQYVDAHGIGGVVHFRGSQPSDVTLDYFKASDIYILHSMVDPETGDEEGLPSTVLEAMAYGLPVVSTLHAGIPEAVTHGETGFLVQEGDAQTMGDYIVTLAGDAALRSTFGVKGWEMVRERYSAEKSVVRLRELLGLHG